MHIAFLGGLSVADGDIRLAINGAGQRAVLFRLALDAGASVGAAELAADVWPENPPANERAALQSVVSRLRSQLPPGSIDSEPGGYRLLVGRGDVDILRFQDLVAAASAADPAEAQSTASDALTLWKGEPWLPGSRFEWLRDQLVEDRSLALSLGGTFPLEAPSDGGVPAPLTGFVGRDRELAAIVEQLAANRLVSIIGTGGAGKTRLAMEASRTLGATIMVELAPVGRTELWQAVLAAVGRQVRHADSAQETVSARDRVLDALSTRRLTIVLDNCEHVIDVAAQVASDLLARLPGLRILATSREPLGLVGESFVTLGPLAHPDAADLRHGIDESVWGRYAALELFGERAAAAQGRPLAPGELVDAARIVVRLDGLPLALELAAAKLRTMSISEVADGLDDRFALLGRGIRGSVPRHQTLRALIDWSWGLLSDDERRALCWLSVWPSGVRTADAAEFATRCGVSRDVLEALVDRSLVQRVAGRFRMLETIREYGIERLAAGGETGPARTALVEGIAEAVERHDPELRGPGILPALEWFDSEEDNISAALRFAVDAGLGDSACRIAATSFWYWVIRDRFADSIEWLVQVSTVAGDVHSEAGALLRSAAPIVEQFTSQGGVESDRVIIAGMLETAARDFRAERASASGSANDLLQLVPVLLGALIGVVTTGGGPGDVIVPDGEELGLGPWPTAALHVMRAAIAQNNGDAEVLGGSSEIAVRMFEELGDLWGSSLSLQMRSEWLVMEGRLDEALAMTLASTEGLSRITSSWDVAQQRGLAVTILARQGRWEEAELMVNSLLEAGPAAGSRAAFMSQLHAATYWMAKGDADRAEEHLALSEAMSSEVPAGIGQLVATAEILRADIAVARGDLESGEGALRVAADQAIRSGDHPVIAQVALGLGVLALERGDHREAKRALELAATIRGSWDATDLKVRRIESAVGPAKARRGNALASARPAAVEELGQILRR